jgi:hypothetical protein
VAGPLAELGPLEAWPLELLPLVAGLEEMIVMAEMQKSQEVEAGGLSLRSQPAGRPEEGSTPTARGPLAPPISGWTSGDV